MTILVGNNKANYLVGDLHDNDTLIGKGGNDVLIGDFNARWEGRGDVLDGGDGRDTLFGGPMADILTGGNGRDVFVFDAERFSQPDTITDFKPGRDKIRLTTDNIPRDMIEHDYDQATGELSVSFFGQSHVVAKLTPGTVLNDNDVLVY